jgi:hypothetical protein
VQQLVPRHGGENSPQVAAALEIERAISGPDEKAAIHRLHHIFGVDARGQPIREHSPGESDQSRCVTAMDFRRGLGVASGVTLYKFGTG